ncbi:MAG: hypothetical protein LBU39_09460 [Desulfobulbaceae bacterium]|nr:hypothetical protein [Desulfobulbaceae bacterium]
MIWRDSNSDGLSNVDELYTLRELGIQRLNVSYTVSNLIDEQGNQHAQTGAFTTDDGARHTMTDVWFLEDPARTVDLNLVEIPDEIAALPDVTAFGNVHDLQQAMARDESGGLRALVTQFAAENDAAIRLALVTEIIYLWQRYLHIF